MGNPCLVSILIPARNEADRIKATVSALREMIVQLNEAGFPFTVEIIVIDDASKDGTAEGAKEAGATRVIRLPHRRGKGGALRAGLKEARGDILFFVDADLGESGGELGEVLAAVLRGTSDMAIAAPPPDPEGGGFGVVQKFSRWMIKRLTGFEAKAPLSGQRAIKREVLTRVKVAEGYGVETALTIDALWEGFRVIEVSVPFRHRAFGKSLKGFMHRAKQLWDILKALMPRVLIGFRKGLQDVLKR